MNFKMKLAPLLTVALFITSSYTQNNPLKNPDICGRPTCKSDGKFRYLQEIEHRYIYSVDIKSLFNGTSKNESTLYIQAEALVDIVSECDGLLTLTDVKMSESSIYEEEDDGMEYGDDTTTTAMHENSEVFADALQEFTLRFAFHDGVISEVCPDPEEKNWALNFKKGLLSMLHNTMRRFDLDHRGVEEDIHGKCEAAYKVLEPDGTSLVIEKTKDLSSCESRSKLHSVVQSTSYNFRPNSHETKPLKSSSKCTLSIDHYIYKEITCSEKHLFQPFSNQNEDAGAMTIVKQNLRLVEEINKILDEQMPIQRRTPLTYDPVPTPKPISDELKISRDLIKKLCEMSKDESVQIEFSDLFTKFIHTARYLSHSALHVLYKRAGTVCPTGKKHVLDALPYLGTSAAVGIMRDATLPDSTINEWMLSVALIPRPDARMMGYLHQLLERNKIPSVSFAASTLTYTFCMQNYDCTSNEVVQGIIQELEDRVSKAYSSKKYDRKTQESIIISLKSLSNIGIIREPFKAKLFEIIEDRQVDVAIRVAAVETYRRSPCEESRLYFEELFRNKEEDTEVRIAAYLQVMRCPNYVVVSTIRHSLEVEEVNQVGSFIWGHLHNLLKSSIPSRVEIQGLLSDKELVKKFSSDVRKFSNNYEGSLYFDDYHVGANYESNVIFSPSSYIPRSAMLNLTVDLFGESINLLEVYGRFEGFEQRLESIFGPRGAFSAKNVKDKMSRMWTRDIDDASNLQSEIDKYSDVIDNNFDNPKINLGLKIFGNEIRYNTFNGDEEVRAALNNINPIEHLKRIFSGNEIKFNKAAMFMDTSYIVPNGAGLPVTLNVVGTASVNMKILGKLNSTNFIKNRSLDLNANIQPNVALDIVGTMSVDAYYAGTGIKLKTSLYTSSAIETSITMRGAELIRVSFGIPKQTTEILGAKSELIVMKGSLEEMQSGIEKNKVAHSVCTWPAVDRAIGLKLCADYHFINVTAMNNTPKFILAGPSGFRLALQKIDPTARTYFMEYQWNVENNRNYITFVLDTPGAQISRLLSINVTHNDETGNLTLQLFSTSANVLAEAKYKNTDFEKYIDVGLDIDHQRKFGTHLSLVKQPINFGFNYVPKLIISVNNDNVAELQGTLKWVEKSGISQSDVNLKFKTKRLTSKLFGYISKTENSVGANLKLDYKFVNTRSETVRLDFSLADKSKRIIAKYIGQAQIQTTAYPNMNFNSSLQFQKASGYTELDMKFECGPTLFYGNNKDPNGITTFKAFLAHRTLVNATKLQVDTSLTKPSSGLDLKGWLAYERVGHWVDTKMLLRYNTGKEILIQAFWSNPKQVLDDIEARLNVTVPSYTPMILKVKVKEQNFHNYAIDIDGVWFTGFTMTMKGIYNYRSVVAMSQHHLKMLLRSPSFNEINADLQYYRDNKELKIDLKADHNNDAYEFYLKHVGESNVDMVTLGKIRYKAKMYSVTSTVSWKEEKYVKVELHLDQLRDIHLAMWGHNRATHKAVGYEIKWDANRDPNQKLVVTVDISNPVPYKYDGNFVVAYPGRTINGLYNFLWIAEKFSTLTHLAWSPEDAFTAKLSIDYRYTHETYVYLTSELLTPFDDVRRTALSFGYRHAGNMYRLNGSVHWQDNQHVSIDLYEDYEALATYLQCEAKAEVSSTVADIPSLSASLKHSHNVSQVDSNLYVMYHPKQIIDLGSSWKIEVDNSMTNLTGTVTILTPFRGLNKGLLVSKIYFTNSRNILGVADLDVDHRKFRATVEGNLQKITRSMLKFDITTPFEKYKEISGRFGIIEEQRHVVCMVTSPTGSLGIEVKLLMHHFTHFDIIFNLATPMDFLQQVLVVGKMEEEQADFRLGWNTLLIGFTGIWHYTNVTDFQHSYKIYTPIEGLEENGIVAKFMFKEGLDFEISIKLAEKRLGITVQSKPKPMILKELGIKAQAMYKDMSGNDGDGLKQVTASAEEDPFSWEGFVEIDTLLYPTMKGTIDIEQKGTVYDILVSPLHLPMGTAMLRNEFDFISIYKMKNRLFLSLPFENLQTITSLCVLDVTPDHEYLASADFNYGNTSQWIETGAQIHYIMPVGDENIYNLLVHLHTPSASIPKLDLAGTLYIDAPTYKLDFNMSTLKSQGSFKGKLRAEENVLDTEVDLYVISPVINIPPMMFNFHKDFSETENKIGLYINTPRTALEKINCTAVWDYESIKNFKAKLEVDVPKTIGKSVAMAEVHTSEAQKYAKASVQAMAIKLESFGRILGDSLTSHLYLNHGNKGKNMTLDAILKPTSDDKRQVEGVIMLNGRAYDISGLAELREDILSNLQLEMSRQDADNAPKITLLYQLTPQSDGYDLSATVRHGSEYATVEARTAFKHKYDWDLDLQVNTSHTTYNSLQVHAVANTIDTNTSFTVDVKIPFADLGTPKLEISLAQIDEYYHASTSFDLSTSSAKCNAVWSWIFLENMSLKLIGNYSENKHNCDGYLNVFYVNPKKTFESLKIGGDLDLNKTWSVGSNLTLSLPVRNKMDVEANIKLSPYSGEVHTVLGKFYEENRYTQIEYLGKYKTNVADTIYGSNGKISFTNLDDIYGDVDVVVGPTHVNNYLEYKTKNNVTNLYYRLRKPKYNEDTVRTYITYKKSLPYHNISCEMFHPGERSVAKADIDFREFGNMNGTVNVTTPFPGFNYTGIHFITETNSATINRFAEIFWVNKTAVLDSKCTVTKKSEKERDSEGVVFLEIPLAHRHIARLDYSYSEKPQISTGQATVEYNGSKVLEGKYNCLSESKAGFDKDTIHVELQNKLLPIGVDYLHGYEYGAPGDGSSSPTVDSKDIHIYNLYNKTALNISGVAIVKTGETGQDIALTATHKNRTVKLWTNYDVYDRKLIQNSRLDLAPTVWIAYDINLHNKTVDESSEAQEIQINLSYPHRNFTALGSYNISEFSLSSEVSLEWDKERKTVQAGLDWKKDKEHPNHHELRLDIKHPSFEKNVSVLGEYESAGSKLADFKVSIDYSPNPEQLVLLTGLLENHSKNNVMNYTYNIKGSHPQTELYLDMNGGVFWKPKYFICQHLSEYNRTNFPQPMEALALVDIENNEIEFKRKTPTELTYLWSRHIGKFPLYTANVSAIYGNDINASGVFYLNFEEKLVQLELNKTTDGSQSLHMYGIIPDARSAIFDIWRDYEDIRVFDVSYLLRLNHSRLLVANLNWRPELKQDIKSGIRSFLLNAYNSFTEGANNARQYVRSEMTDAISAVWRDVKPQIHQFLDDVKNLNVIKDDLQELRIFLNESYYANEFYVRDITGFLLSTIDDLSLKSHLENLPAIVSEIWEAMGESGKKIQKSIVWVIEKIKMYYKNLTEFINGLLQGESLEHLSDTFQEFLEKYDNFIKEMHVSFIRYIEDLWNKTYRMLVNNWNKTLASIEPTLIKIAHYLEAILWNAGQEFIDFLYIRQNEIIGSEYFNRLANFTQDVDRFYKDITGNDTLGAIYKYTKITWKFVAQKYFELVPFAKELQQVFSEIINEITELKTQPSIQFLLVKIDELYENARWFYNYFDVQSRLHRLITLVRLKLTDARQNALDTENRYREAKTKFIFEPADGVMYLEQKLPMSWHAFNETPKFDELPEYQAIKNAQKYFSISKLTLMNLYMDYNPIVEPSEWFPPFKAQAMLVGGRHYITFDRSVYDFRGECTYLLATDFKDSNFSIAVSYYNDNTRSYKLLILIEKVLIQIDMKTKAVKIGNNKDSALPVQIEHAYVYQEADIIYLRSDYGFLLECNMKFDICIFRVSGWYFGKTAGLWGTMNNERYDDFLTSRGEHVDDVTTFTRTWSLDNECSTASIVPNIMSNATENVRTRCESLFSNKVSPFVTCFPRVAPDQFFAICLKSTTEEEICSAAVAYMGLCSHDGIPLRIPDTCIKCHLLNETTVSEGEFIILEGSAVPRSADIVFVVEASKCNVNVRRNRKIDTIAENLEKELTALNIKDNRYSVLAFGNDNAGSHPRSIVINSTVFTGHQLIPDFFNHIKYGESGTSDVFQAIVSASKLLFRPGVSKTFILLPCTDCRESRMQLDYSILHQLLLENDITLHILMNEDFRAKKARGGKIFFGIDRTMAYTKKDVDDFKGDGKLRKEIQLPKTNLGFCMPLAMESNGAIFTGKKLETKMAARVASVFAKRIAKSAQPKQCKTCECTAFNTGVSYMECYPCSYPTPITSYSPLNEDELLMAMQPGDNFEYDEY